MSRQYIHVGKTQKEPSPNAGCGTDCIATHILLHDSVIPSYFQHSWKEDTTRRCTWSTCGVEMYGKQLSHMRFYLRRCVSVDASQLPHEWNLRAGVESGPTINMSRMKVESFADGGHYFSKGFLWRKLKSSFIAVGCLTWGTT